MRAPIPPHLCRRGTRRRDDGMVTAEAALVLPLLALATVAMIALFSVVLAKLAVIDAARDGARALARGDAPEAVMAAAAATAPDGADVHVETHDDTATVTVRAASALPAWLPVAPIVVSARSTLPLESDASPR